MVRVIGNGIKLDTGGSKEIKDSPDYTIHLVTEEGYKVYIHVGLAISIAEFMIKESEINDEDKTKGHHRIKRLKKEIKKSEKNQSEILEWIEGRLNKIRTRESELNKKNFLYKTEDREAGRLKAKESLLEELKEYVNEDCKEK